MIRKLTKIERISYYPESNKIIEIKEGSHPINGNDIMFVNKYNLGSLEKNLRDDTLIIVYDPFNPFILKPVLNKTVELTRENGAILTVYPLDSTLKKVKRSGKVKKTIDRNEHRKIQLRVMTDDFFMEKIMNHDFFKKMLNLFYKSDLVKKIDYEIRRVLDIMPKW
ncbi:hypothetical protein ES703_66240 [subsurface metagenome]